jgi:hypothetical protein
LAAALCALLFCAAGWSLYVEAGAYDIGTGADARRLERIEGGRLAPAFSSASAEDALTECDWAMTSLFGTLQPGGRVRGIAAACAKLAGDVAADRPTSAHAFLIRALAASRLGDVEELNRALVLCQRYAPNSQWLARARMALAERHEAELSDASRAAEDADIAVLVHSYHGIEAVAERDLRDPAARERITGVVETLATQDQARFLSRVRQASAPAEPAAP